MTTSPRSSLLFEYRLLAAALFPLVAVHAAWLGRRHRDGRFVRERLGFPATRAAHDPVWVHAASVGEVNAALPLIAEIHRRHPRTPVLLTTATPTGGALARRHVRDGLTHAYLPFDRTGAVRRFLAAYRPRAGIVVETELWPNLYAACAEAGVPLVIVNGRVSPRTLRAPVWLRDLYARCLAGVKAVLARSPEDRDGFLALGAPPAAVHVLGNLKFAAPARAAATPIALGRPYVLAASTREGEEVKVVEAWRQSGSAHLLVVAPRHPKRLHEVLADLKPFGLSVAVRSRGDAISEHTRVYVADTFGELEGFMAGAELVYMGGSLVPKGGHNVLEPARLGRAVVFGPHMDNFTEEARLLLQEDAAVQVHDTAALAACFRELLDQPARRVTLGERARAAVAARSDVATRYADAIDGLIPDLQNT
ncbi:MAG: 3-deoxy-D-manno-octulosonic acid transferase [Thiohalomonadaceae bacterium]